MKKIAKSYMDYYIHHKTDEKDIETIFQKDKRIFKYHLHHKTVDFFHNKTIDAFYIQRGKALQYLFEMTIKKYPLSKDIIVYLYIGDELPERYKKYPILTFAKPQNDPGILIPDWSFIDPYTSKISKSWDDLVKKVYDECPSPGTDNIFYFRGRNTSKNTGHDIRKKMYDFSLEHPFLNIKLDPDNEQQITDWCKYKYLLDLPGSSPWSVRFKELFLLKSVVIKIDTVTKKNKHNTYINFYTPMFKPGKDYIQLLYIYDTKDGFKNCMDKLIEIYKSKDEKKYKTILKNGRRRIKELTIDKILDYMDYIFKHYHECLISKQISIPISKQISIYDHKRPCSSKSRQTNRYTRHELHTLLYKLNIPFKTKDTIDQLCKKLSSSVDNQSQIMEVFKKKFYSDLTDWITKDTTFRVLLKGGQNFNILMKENHKINVPYPTSDYDFTISTKKPQETYLYWLAKINEFIKEYPDVLSIKINNFFPGKKVAFKNITKYYTIFVFYKGEDFIDLSINDEKIYRRDVDKTLTDKIGLPIQTIRSTFKELTNLIYRQSVLTTSYSYRKRNAFVGKSRQKGIKDLNRFEILCGVHDFKPQCDVLKKLQYHFPVIKEYLDKQDIVLYTDLIKEYLGKSII